jgi:serine/threonine protein kinase/tetratricopeptide (TPR) repeat protein
VLPGDIVNGRFEIERLAGSGGMGAVYRALDRSTGELVAVKVLLEGRTSGESRFEREAQLLSEMRHPGLARYVAHGAMASGERYLVMEWLEGEDLSWRLQRSRLTIEESLLLTSRVAEALEAVHAHGVIHRDLKPSNLFLVGRRVVDVKILDFGVARFGGVTGSTQTGTMLGTLGYMAPEQARSGQALDSRADVFALGCVLFECLAGVPAFAGAHLMALLAKILFEEAPRVSDLRPEVSDKVDALVARMLSKDPEDRPRDGAAVAAEIAALGGIALSTGPSSSEEPTRPSSRIIPALTGGEQRLLSVVLLGAPNPGDAAIAATLGATGLSTKELSMRETSESRGGRFELLADGTVLVTIGRTTRIATDQAALGARCALALRELGEGRPMALATGRAEVTGQVPVGEAIDRAARMLSKRSGAGVFEEGKLAPIAIDEVSAGLLDGRFDVRGSPEGLWLHGERARVEGTRTLLGTPTACVGRDRELATLQALFAECVESPAAQAVLVTARAGYGKSRIAHELLRAIAERGEPVEIWIGRGDSLRAGSAFGLLGQALRSACAIIDGEPVGTRQQKLRARVARHVPAADQRRVTEFLGELVGTPFPDDESLPLRAARQDALVMGDQMRRAWEDFLRAESSAQPVLLVLEDLHWGDLPTVRFVDAALRDLKSQPWMVLALARPEVHELFPKLWTDRGVQEMRLKELTGKASERLIRQVLGASVSADTVGRLVAQADGHAFFLEELIRAVAEGKGAALPETVLAMVEARLEGLESEARRVLRAASIFGEVFWHGGLASLLGGPGRTHKTQDWLAALVEREVLVRRNESRFPGEQEFAFRHALLREGAYAMLTEGDRVLGHKLAAQWLDDVGEHDPMVLAEHLERAREPARAGGYYLRAAEQAQRGGDTDAAMKRARRGLECNVPDAVHIALVGILCESHAWRREWQSVAPYADELMRLAAPGSAPWAQAAPAKLIIALGQGRIDEFMSQLHLLQSVDPAPDAVGSVLFGLSAGAFILDGGGRFDLSEGIVQRQREIVASLAEPNPLALAWLNMTAAYRETWHHEDPWLGLQCAKASLEGFLEVGHLRSVALAQVLIGMNLWRLGALPEAERTLRETLHVDDEDIGLTASTRRVSLVCLLADAGALDEARLEASRALAAGLKSGQPADEGRGRWLVAEIARRSGELEVAAREATASIDLLAMAPLDQAAATATLAAVHLAAGRTAEALTLARTAMSRYEATRGFGYRGTFARLVHAEALWAAGERGAAIAAFAAAREQVVATSAKIADASYRALFLEAIPENKALLARG